MRASSDNECYERYARSDRVQDERVGEVLQRRGGVRFVCRSGDDPRDVVAYGDCGTVILVGATKVKRNKQTRSEHEQMILQAEESGGCVPIGRSDVQHAIAECTK